MDTIDCFGEFWIPDYSDEKLPGLLTFSSEEGIALRIMGRFGYKEATASDKEYSASYFYNNLTFRIYGTYHRADGINMELEYVTLEDAYFRSGSKNGMEFSSERLLLGGHYSSGMQVSKACAVLDKNFTYWVAEKYGMSLNLIDGTFNVPEDESYGDGKQNINVKFSSMGHTGRHDMSEMLSAMIVLEYLEPVALDIAMSDITNLSVLASAALKYPVILENIFVYPQDKSKLSYFSEPDYKSGIDVLFKINSPSNYNTDRSPYIFPLVKYQEIGIKGLFEWWKFSSDENIRGKIPYITGHLYGIQDAGDMLVKTTAIIQTLARKRNGMAGVSRSLQIALQAIKVFGSDGLLPYEKCCWCYEIEILRGKQAAHFEDTPSIPYLHRQATAVYYLLIAYILKESGIISDSILFHKILHGDDLSRWVDESYQNQYHQEHKWQQGQNKCRFCKTVNHQ